MHDHDSIASAYGTGRLTAPRREIARAACEMGAAFTVEELAEVVRARDESAGATATVYRAVAAMEAASFLERVGARDGSALYARCGHSGHHHHVVCDGCGRVAHAECPLDDAMSAASADSGFVVTRHEVTLYGLCPACLAEGKGR